MRHKVSSSRNLKQLVEKERNGEVHICTPKDEEVEVLEEYFKIVAPSLLYPYSNILFTNLRVFTANHPSRMNWVVNLG